MAENLITWKLKNETNSLPKQIVRSPSCKTVSFFNSLNWPTSVKQTGSNSGYFTSDGSRFNSDKGKNVVGCLTLVSDRSNDCYCRSQMQCPKVVRKKNPQLKVFNVLILLQKHYRIIRGMISMNIFHLFMIFPHHTMGRNKNCKRQTKIN